MDMITSHRVNTQFDTNTLKMDGLSILCHPEQFYHRKLAFEIKNVGRVTTLSAAWIFFYCKELF